MKTETNNENPQNFAYLTVGMLRELLDRKPDNLRVRVCDSDIVIDLEDEENEFMPIQTIIDCDDIDGEVLPDDFLVFNRY